MARLLLLALAAAALPAGRGALRYCDCTFQGNRHSVAKEICSLTPDEETQPECSAETLPYISPGFTFYSSKPQRMFKHFALQTTAHKALEICKQEGGTLARPLNKEMINHMLRNLRTDDVWILINYTDEKKEGVWLDFDGNPAPKLPWAKNRPDNWKGDENCLHIHAKKGHVNDINCFTTYYTFICERTLRKNVPKGYTYHDLPRTFFKLYKEEKPFHLAKKTCEDDGGKLTAPEDWFKAFSVLFVIREVGFHADFYVDFTDEAEEGNFITSEGRRMEDMEFRNWRPDDPDNGAPFGPENCVTLNWEGFFADIPCESTQPFVCELNPF
ncbi:macrophage mannose receptor 1-like isoform X1 [Schistocerca gregaria]|uniref:macrophage mannose receptor 1-like isoform X1 n=1 Tax=Schistocerca gregaria TaxID=7010 RepID=UPI00211DE820|nr:macrophage mannose receptor 1-like isoform X1 [Schistocerca gregaria]